MKKKLRRKHRHDVHEKRGFDWKLVLVVLLAFAFVLYISNSPDLGPKSSTREVEQDSLKFTDQGDAYHRGDSKYLAGDANADGRLSLDDAILMAQLMHGDERGRKVKAQGNPDANGDGRVTEEDMKRVLYSIYEEPQLGPGSSSSGGSGSSGPGGSSNPFGSIICDGPFVRGDVNRNGGPDIFDISHLLAVLFVGSPYQGECFDRADANDDENVDIADAISMIMATFTPGTLPGPFPQPGFDESGHAGWKLCDGINNDGDTTQSGFGLVDEGECTVDYKLHFGESMGGVGPAVLDETHFGDILREGIIQGRAYTQTVTLAPPLTMTHFSDGDFQNGDAAIGIQMNPNDEFYDYELEFTGAGLESQIGPGGALPDFAFQQIDMYGDRFMITDADYLATSGTLLMDLSHVGVYATIPEGELAAYVMEGEPYHVEIGFIDPTTVILVINGESTNALNVGDTYLLSSGVYVGITDITYQPFAGGIAETTFTLGKGIYTLNQGQDIEVNGNTDERFVIEYDHAASGSTFELHALRITRRADDEEFIAFATCIPGAGCGSGGGSGGPQLPIIHTFDFSVRSQLQYDSIEGVGVQNNGDDGITLEVDGMGIDILYGDATGTSFAGIGESETERLATGAGAITYYEKQNGNDYHKYFPVSYIVGGPESESYLLKALITEESGTNYVTIRNVQTGNNICEDLPAGDTCDVGQHITLTVDQIVKTAAEERVVLLSSPGSGVSFHRWVTNNGLVIQLPMDCSIAPCVQQGAFNPGDTTFELWMIEENAAGSTASGHDFNLNLGFNSNGETTILGTTGDYASGVSGSPTSVYQGFLEVQGVSDVLEAYIDNSHLGTRIMMFTGGDQDVSSIYYPEPEAYAEFTFRGRN